MVLLIPSISWHDRFLFIYLFFLHDSPPVGLGLLLIHGDFCGFCITDNDTPQSVGFLWTSDQLVAETPAWQHNTHNRQTDMPPVGFELMISRGERP
jgi:hypothetical protein